MKLSVIILNYNVRYFLELCLKSVEAAIANIEAEIIVVDNHSQDDSCSMLKAKFPSINLIENKENFGFSKGNNIGVAKAKGEYICILNPDTVVAEDTFTKILNFAEKTENLGAIGCKLINGIGEFLPESKRHIPYVNAAFKKILGNSNDYYANNLKQNEVGEVEVLVGAFMLLKRETFNEIHGFDEDYFMYGEDIDLSYKLIKAGFKNYYFGEATVIHYKGESTLKNKFYARRFYGAMKIFYKKHFKRNYFFDVFVNLGIAGVYFFRTNPKGVRKQPSRYLLVSNSVCDKLKNTLKKQIELSDTLYTIKPETEVIFDANVSSYKRIINLMETKPDNSKLSFKILPNQSNFIIGSDDTICKGEIIEFN
ncbi:glycosyl transferase family 2 [Tamlana sedimentorum]|uniref:Glycosyl transferase family 2 n=1 Tax=Neotamlana sedimentorum TaxID=1435349 RepID=A0A0D7WDH2_9FLAO|nr:glycosyltransferase family 2 protein [Tamlana sedimentorum]KJD35772.1 glycosyl transferase family 2 [Tamlana sedimentorum]